MTSSSSYVRRSRAMRRGARALGGSVLFFVALVVGVVAVGLFVAGGILGKLAAVAVAVVCFALIRQAEQGIDAPQKPER